MSDDALQLEPRYLSGIVLFNRQDYFEAHEVWESLWLDECIGEDRRFVQSLIQSAVGLYHFSNRNYRGALKLYKSAKAYMERYPSPHMGLDGEKFWSDMERCFSELLAAGVDAADIPLRDEWLPTIELNPPPETWPNPDDYLEDEEH